MRRSALGLLLALCASAYLPSGRLSAAERPPVKSEAITYLQGRKILGNPPESTLRLADPLTRAEALAAVIRSRERFAPQVLWFSKNLPAISLFEDSDQSQWYAPYVEVGFLSGMMTGYQDGTFRPGVPLTIEQALVLLQRAHGWKGTPLLRSSEKLPNRDGQWYTEAVSEAIDRNFLPADMRLTLGTPITRGEFFEILYRTHVTQQRREYAFEEEGTEGSDGIKLGTSAPSVPSVPSVPLSSLPLHITPLPFREEDPFVIRLPQSERRKPQPLSSSLVYASQKPFAITIPSLGILDFSVTHPHDPFSEQGVLTPLRSGLGHLFSYPGSQGKAMIYGHSSSWPWDRSEYTRAFRRINKLAMGDRVYVTYDRKLTVYEVTKKQIIAAADTSPFHDDGREELILYTCWPPDSVRERYLVHALPVETVALR